jgi:hypothetical protein
MLAVTIVSVALSSLIALAAIAAGVWEHRKGREHERGIADRESVRDTLAETAAILHRAEYAIDDLHVTLLQHGSTMFDPAHPERVKCKDDLEETGRELDLAVGRLRILLGPKSSVTAALEEADAALLDAFRALGLIRLEDPEGEGRRAQRIESVNDEQRERIERDRDDFKAAQARFVERAHAVAGADLRGDED